MREQIGMLFMIVGLVLLVEAAGYRLTLVRSPLSGKADDSPPTKALLQGIAQLSDLEERAIDRRMARWSDNEET
jgi:hypothetical protein